MAGEQGGFIGGVEHQQSMMARWLAARGHDVSLITWDEGHADGERIDGVRVLNACRADAGIPGLRFVIPRWTSLVSAMTRADARVYYQNCAEYVTGQVALFARRRGRGFVYSVASDPDCDPLLPTLRTRRERILYRYGLRRADRVVVQTRAQKRMLSEGFGRESTTIPMPCIGPRDAEYEASRPPASGRARVAWVGRVAPVKRLELLLEVASRLPHVGFDIAGPWDQDGIEMSRLRAKAESVPNVEILGRLTREQLPGFYRSHHALLCTSAFEGFPNTFLEAWSHGLPIVSTVDPDGLIAERSLGFAADDVAGLVEALQLLLDSEDVWKGCSTRARSYFVANHDFDSVMPQFEEIFATVAGQHSA